ncbi:MAG: glycosyltransferase [bacterium]
MDSPISSPLVSVVLLAYNQPEFLNQAIEGVCAQTFTDYELLVIDDCSGEEITSQYRLPENARLIILPEHFGWDTRGRNVGVKEAKGKFIAFHDNDDIWLPDKLETQVRLLNENPDAALAYCHYIFTDSTLKPLPKQYKSEPPARDMVRQIIQGCFLHCASTILVKRDALTATGPFDESLPGGTDWDMWIRLSINHRFLCDPTPRILYRTHPNQISKNLRQEFWRIAVLTNTLDLIKRVSPKHTNCVRSRLSWACRKMAKIRMSNAEPLPDISALLIKAMNVWPWSWKTYALFAWLPFYRLSIISSRKQNNRSK